MRKIFLTIQILLISLAALSQKVQVQVIKTINVAVSEWQILDENNNPVFSGDEYFREDSVSIFLEANKKYQLEISVSEVYNTDTTLYSLAINSEAVMLIRSDLAAGDHFFGFFTGVRQEQGKITGGTGADIAAFPWQVFYESGDYTCGGSIISGDWIITAAHCTEDDYGNAISASQMDVIVGANNPRTGLEGKKYYVSKVIVHEKYNKDTYDNDIALLQLKTSIDYSNATPIRLVSKIDSIDGVTNPGVMSWVTGYGLTKVVPPTYPVTLQKVQLPIISIAQASTVWPDIPSSDLMAGFKSGNKDACSGDSGGPLVVPVNNEFKLAGLVSWGSSNCNSYGGYTRISVFESWITSKTGIEISYVPPVPSGDSIICRGVTSSEYNAGTITGATLFEWQLLPSGAGTILGNSGNAVVSWNLEYIGAATIKLRVTRYNVVSYWSSLTVHVADYNKLVSQSGDTVVCAGNPVDLKVITEGYNRNFSWYKNGTLLKSGKVSDVNFRNPVTGNTGLYRCDITGSCGESVSAQIDLTVLPVTKITYLTPDSEVSSGADATLSVTSEGHNLTYQWQKDTDQLIDGISPEYLLQDVNAKNTGLYRVDVAGSCGEVLSNNVYVFVRMNDLNDDPEVFVWPTVVSDELNIAISNEQIYNLLIYSSTGKLIKDKLNCEYKTTINISDIPGGLYIITIYNNNFKKSVKLIKK